MTATQYEQQFTAFVDFLGFTEMTIQTDDQLRAKVLDLLFAISTLRGEFDVQTEDREVGRSTRFNPAISAFSDHIVVSYPIQPMEKALALGTEPAAFLILNHFKTLLTRIAAAALRIGFLIRGGATIKKLFHARGVVFGEALIEAYLLESRTSIYPRVVLSPAITSRPEWIREEDVLIASDGLYHVDYFKALLLESSAPGSGYGGGVKGWFEEIVPIVERNLRELRTDGKLNEFAKWSWFANHFRSGLERTNPALLEALGISLQAISWPR